MSYLSFVRRLSPEVCVLLALTFITASGALLWRQAAAVREMREIGLPAAVALPQLEHRLQVLKDQTEAAHVQAALGKGTEEELLRLYVLPETENTSRLLATFDVLFGYLEKRNMLIAYPDFTVGEAEDVEPGLQALPVSLHATLTPDGFQEWMHVLDLAGLLTIADAVDDNALQYLLQQTERENPGAIAALEQFLSTDLLRYSEEPRSYEEQLRRSFATEEFSDALHALLESEQLRHARDVYSDLAPVLRAQNLWPLRFLTVRDAAVRTDVNGNEHVEMMLNAYVRR